MSENLKPCPFCGGNADMIMTPHDSEEVEMCGCHNCGLFFDGENAALEWNTRSIPEGYTLVPVEPSKAMCDAFWHELSKDECTLASDTWRAMIAAAQEEAK